MVETKRPGRPRQDPQLRRNEILEAAVPVFSKHGYRDTDMQHVADAVGVAKGTLYIYFKTKEALFLAAVDHSIEQLADHIDRAVRKADGPVDKIRAIVSAYFRFFDRDPALARIIVREGGEFMSRAENTYYRVFTENASRLEEILRDGMDREIFRRADPKRTADFLADVLGGTVYTYLLGRKKGRAAAATKATVEFLLHGLLAEGVAV